RVTKASRASNWSSAARSSMANLRGRNMCGLRSILRRAWCARVGDGVADVAQAADVDQQALEAEAEAGMRHRAIAAEVAIPLVVRGIQAELRHACVEDVQALLALAAADDLADARCQYFHGGDSATIVVETHVKGLDLLGVIHYH